MPPTLSVREIEERDIEHITRYWVTADPSFLLGMGVDLDKMPPEEAWIEMLSEQLRTPVEQKKSYCIIWEVDGQPVGHSNINKIIFGQEAYMHLHMWRSDVRRQGMGTELVKLTIPWFFRTYQLKTLFCEPSARNKAPNKTLSKAGFSFVKEYMTVPSWICSEQPVSLWEMTLDRYHSLGLG